MRGTILGFDNIAGEGVITSEPDGMRYKFSRADFKDQTAPKNGLLVDFEAQAGRATDIYPLANTSPVGDLMPKGDADKALWAGGLSLGLSLFSFVPIPVINIACVIAAIFFGLRGRKLGRNLPDKLPYYLATAGLIISILAIFVVVIALVACAGVLGTSALTARSLGGFR